MNLLAKSCFCPGIISLLGNLVKSAGEPDLESIQHEYLKEYMNGMGHEIYRVLLSPKFGGQKFVEIAATVYKQFQGIIFGLEIQIESETLVVLNPGNYTIPQQVIASTYVYVICEDKDVADQVTAYNLNQEEVETDLPDASPFAFDQGKKDHEAGMVLEIERRPDWAETLDEEDQEKHQDLDHINLLELDFVVLEEPQNIMSITMISIQNSPTIKDHIVVCGLHTALYAFILPQRARYLKEWQYIVILNKEPPSPELWNQISIFPKLIYIKGCALTKEDLIRANIKNANKAVIMDSSNKSGDGRPGLSKKTTEWWTLPPSSSTRPSRSATPTFRS